MNTRTAENGKLKIGFDVEKMEEPVKRWEFESLELQEKEPPYFYSFLTLNIWKRSFTLSFYR